MNIIKCSPSTPDVRVTCITCGKGLLHSEAYADLAGQPFRAYYHQDCLPGVAYVDPDAPRPAGAPDYSRDHV